MIEFGTRTGGILGKLRIYGRFMAMGMDFEGISYLRFETTFYVLCGRKKFVYK